MSLKKQWVATCDEPGCPATFTGRASLPLADFGESLNDAGWAAAPRRPQTFCPDHFREFEEFEPDPELIERAARKMAEAFAAADDRQRRAHHGH